ncbi:Predicted RNA-binding protein, contains PUA-like domain [Mucilaginibacter sp. OK098]|nr:Predicted RNA-binding protein, contains PUA-like domain [Mucilaginibacter sp. OK098]
MFRYVPGVPRVKMERWNTCSPSVSNAFNSKPQASMPAFVSVNNKSSPLHLHPKSSNSLSIFPKLITFGKNLNMQYWLVKSEPVKYSWEKFNKEGRTFWDGVRNYQARNNLREMKEGDLVLFYHSNDGKEVVGIAKVAKEFYQDPTTSDPNWVVIDLVPVESLKTPVTLEEIKADERLKEVGLVRQGRLSVMGLKREEFDRIVELGSR